MPGQSLITKTQLTESICAARHAIRLLGVVAADPAWLQIIKSWASRSSGDTPRLEVLCEASNVLFARALTSDSEHARNRVSFRELEFIRSRVVTELPKLLRENGIPVIVQEQDLEKVGGQPRCSIRVSHLPMPISVAEVDGRLFLASWLHEVPDSFELLEPTDPRHDEIKRYLDTYFDPNTGGKYADFWGAEVLELFDHERIPRGIYPRSSFYDTDYSQLVIWGLVFDRRGRLLIHRRSDNAKDNQSMWDKSVGGHVDFRKDVDTSRAMARELLEELFTDELKKEDIGDIKAWTVTDEDILYMGEWRPDRRGFAPMHEIEQLTREWAFFRLRNSQSVYSPRTLPSGQVRRLRVIADVYLFVAGPGLGKDSLGQLQNSTFKLLELSELKTAMDRALRGDKVPRFERQNMTPAFSPDLVNIMTGELRDILEDFSQHIKSYIVPT